MSHERRMQSAVQLFVLTHLCVCSVTCLRATVEPAGYKASIVVLPPSNTEGGIRRPSAISDSL